MFDVAAVAYYFQVSFFFNAAFVEGVNGVGGVNVTLSRLSIPTLEFGRVSCSPKPVHQRGTSTPGLSSTALTFIFFTRIFSEETPRCRRSYAGVRRASLASESTRNCVRFFFLQPTLH